MQACGIISCIISPKEYSFFCHLLLQIMFFWKIFVSTSLFEVLSRWFAKMCVCVCVFVWWCSRTFASLSWTLNIIKHFEPSNCYLFTSLFFSFFSFSFGLLWLFLQGLEQLSLYPSGNRLCVVTFARQTRSNRHLDISECFLYFLVASRPKWMNVYKFQLKFLKLRWWRFDPGNLCVSAVVPWK